MKSPPIIKTLNRHFPLKKIIGPVILIILLLFITFGFFHSTVDCSKILKESDKLISQSNYSKAQALLEQHLKKCTNSKKADSTDPTRLKQADYYAVNALAAYKIKQNTKAYEYAKQAESIYKSAHTSVSSLASRNQRILQVQYILVVCDPSLRQGPQ